MMTRLARYTLLSSLLLPGLVWAQQAQTGRVAGKIFDKTTGEPILEAFLIVMDASTSAQTDAQGVYFIDGVPVGTYTLRIYKAGYDVFDVKEVKVENGKTISLDIALPRTAAEAAEDSPAPSGNPATASAGAVSGEDIVDLMAFEVTATAIQSQNVEQVMLRQQSLGAVEMISAENIARLAASDVAEIATKLPGINVAGGKYAVVRGLNDRYSTTQLNGIVMPSPDPDRQAVQLDIFPSAMIDSVVASKTYTPDLPGESSGSSMNIKTKGLPEERLLKVSFGVGFRENTTDNENFLTTSTDEDDYLALGYDDRVFPVINLDEGVRGSDGRLLPVRPNGTLFPNKIGAPGVDTSGSIAYGDSFPIFKKQRIGFIGALNWKREFSFAEKQRTSRVTTSDGRMFGDTPDWAFWEESTEEVQLSGLASFAYRPSGNHRISYTYFLTRVGTDEADIARMYQTPENIAAYEATYFDPASTKYNPSLGNRAYWFGSKNVSSNTLASSIGYQERELQLHQFDGHHYLPELADSTLDWAVSYSTNVQDENVGTLQDIGYSIARKTFSTSGSGDFWLVQNLRETDQQNLVARIDYELPLGFFKLSDEVSLKFGVQLEDIKREMVQLESPVSAVVNGLTAPHYFVGTSSVGQNAGNSWVNFTTRTAEGAAIGTREIKSAYLMAGIPFHFGAIRNNLMVGARYEDAFIEFRGVGATAFASSLVLAYGAFDPSKPYGDPTRFSGETTPIDSGSWLPAITLNSDITDKFKIRTAYSRTVARPSFRELAPFPTFSLTDDSVEFGNPGVTRNANEPSRILMEEVLGGINGLEESRVDNFDLRFEYYFGADSSDLVSLSLFYKTVTKPIERYRISDNRFTFENNENDGSLSGIELELSRNLGVISDWLTAVTVGGNLTYVNGTVKRSRREYFRLVTPLTVERRFFDQPEYIVNAYINYQHESWGLDSTLSVNWISDRLVAVGGTGDEETYPGLFDEEFATLNLVISKKLTESLSLKLSIKNLTDPWIKQVYDPELGLSVGHQDLPGYAPVGFEDPYARSSYKKGRSYSLSLSYDFF